MGLVSLFFSVRGRINRAQYWLCSFVIGVVFMAGFIVAGFAASGAAENAPKAEATATGIGTFMLALFPVLILICWASISVQVKRFHDRGRSWWFVLLPFVPALLMGSVLGEAIAHGGSPLDLALSLQPYMFIGWLINLYVFVELGCLPSVEGPNKFGPPPGKAGPIEPTRPSGAVDAASSLFGAQSAMDRAIADSGKAQTAPPRPAASAPAFAAARSPIPATPSFGKRVTT